MKKGDAVSIVGLFRLLHSESITSNEVRAINDRDFFGKERQDVFTRDGA